MIVAREAGFQQGLLEAVVLIWICALLAILSILQRKYFLAGLGLAVAAAGLCAWGIAHPDKRNPLTRLSYVLVGLVLVLSCGRFMELFGISLGSFVLYWATIWITVVGSIRFLLLPFGVEFNQLLSSRIASEGSTQPEILRRKAISIGVVVRPMVELFGFFLLDLVFWILSARHAASTFVRLPSESVIGLSLIFISISAVVWFLSWNQETRESFKKTAVNVVPRKLILIGLSVLYLWGIYFGASDQRSLWTICILFLAFVTAASQRLSTQTQRTIQPAVGAPTQRFSPKWTTLYVLLLLFVTILMGGVFSLTLGANQ